MIQEYLRFYQLLEMNPSLPESIRNKAEVKKHKEANKKPRKQLEEEKKLGAPAKQQYVDGKPLFSFLEVQTAKS